MPSFKERWERWPWFNKLVSVISNVLRKTSFCSVEYIFSKSCLYCWGKPSLKSGKLLVQVVEPANDTNRIPLCISYWLCPVCAPYAPNSMCFRCQCECINQMILTEYLHGISSKPMDYALWVPHMHQILCASDANVNVLRKSLDHLNFDHPPVNLGCTWSGTWSRSYTWSASTSLQKDHLLYFAV